MQAHNLERAISILVGAITFSGSIVAWGKLDGRIRSSPFMLLGKYRHHLNGIIIVIAIILSIIFMFTKGVGLLIVICFMALFLGWNLVMGIGGADMPVVVSMLNSYSGWATSAAGFMI